MNDVGVDARDINVRARVDADQGTPATEAVALGARSGARKARHPQPRGPQRTDWTR